MTPLSSLLPPRGLAGCKTQTRLRDHLPSLSLLIPRRGLRHVTRRPVCIRAKEGSTCRTFAPAAATELPNGAVLFTFGVSAKDVGTGSTYISSRRQKSLELVLQAASKMHQRQQQQRSLRMDRPMWGSSGGASLAAREEEWVHGKQEKFAAYKDVRRDSSTWRPLDQLQQDSDEDEASGQGSSGPGNVSAAHADEHCPSNDTGISGPGIVVRAPHGSGVSKSARRRRRRRQSANGATASGQGSDSDGDDAHIFAANGSSVGSQAAADSDAAAGRAAGERPKASAIAGAEATSGQNSDASGSDSEPQQTTTPDDEPTEEAAPPWPAKLLAAVVWLVGRVLSGAWRPVLLLWWALPFRLRWALRLGRRPPPPQVHAAPALAKLLTKTEGASLTDRHSAAAEAGFNTDGRAVGLPLQDLPRWRLEWLLGMPVRNVALYRVALTSASVLQPHLLVSHSYERLEYLGDAVLLLAIRSLLMRHYPQADEGALTQVQQGLVDYRAMARVAQHLQLERFNVSNCFSMMVNGHHGSTMRGDMVEALLGAIFQDQGWDAARRFTEHLALDVLGVPQATLNQNYKGILFEQCRLGDLGKPRLHVERLWRNDSTVWESTITLQGKEVGSGSGSSKREAEQNASREAVELLAPDALEQCYILSIS